MTMLAEMRDAGALTLADYEARIHLYKEQIGTGYIGIGRTLIEAKAAGVVPHGEWEAWVTRVTGLTERQAQRCMQAAREIRNGSALARLEMSKALALLSSGLDEEAREAVAARAAEEGTSLRQLQAELAEARARAESAKAAAINEGNKARQACAEAVEAERQRDQARTELRATERTVEALQGNIRDADAENAELRGQLTNVRSYLAQEVEKARQAGMEEATAAARAAVEAETREELEGLRRAVADFQDELAAAEAREARKAAELERLRQEKTAAALDAGRGVTASATGSGDIGAAVRAFLGAAGVLPQMGAAVQRMSPAERETIRQHVESVAAWVDGARAALGAIPSAAAVR